MSAQTRILVIGTVDEEFSRATVEEAGRLDLGIQVGSSSAGELGFVFSGEHEPLNRILMWFHGVASVYGITAIEISFHESSVDHPSQECLEE